MVAVYTAGHIVVPVNKVIPDPVTGSPITVKSPAAKTSIFASPYTFTYAPGGLALGTVVADTVALTGGGDITVAAQGSVLSRRDMGREQQHVWPSLESRSGGVVRQRHPVQHDRARRPSEQPWRQVDEGIGVGGKPTATISTQLFREGIGALGGGNVSIDAGGSISDITVVSETSLASTTTTPPGAAATNVLLTLGGGNVAIRAGWRHPRRPRRRALRHRAARRRRQYRRGSADADLIVLWFRVYRSYRPTLQLSGGAAAARHHPQRDPSADRRRHGGSRRWR